MAVDAAHPDVIESTPQQYDNTESQPTEESPLITKSVSRDGSPTKAPRASPAPLISLLLIGVFIANADSSLVLATNNTIASAFSSLSLAPWLTTSYIMTSCCAQPVIGKLSSIYSRKSVLLTCYAIFAVGSGLCGVGQTMGQVIGGRGVAGLGGAGMTVVVSILITDLVEVRDIASWRSYVNVFATTGRMIGGPLGGWLADVVGWRWSFLGQVPLIVLAMLLVTWRLDSRVGMQDDEEEEDMSSKFKKIDFIGTILLSGSIVSFLISIDILGNSIHISSHLKTFIPTLVASVVLLATFLIYESYYAISPLFPPSLLLHRSVWTSYMVSYLQSGAQLSLMFSVPLYFQVVFNASNTSAGAHLLPAFFANTIGSLATGYYIKRSGRYKNITIIGTLFGVVAYITVISRWHEKGVGFWESLEIAPGGLSTAIVTASAFIVLTAGLKHESVAIATGGYYLVGNLGTVVGVGVSSGIQRGVLRLLLGERLPGKDGSKMISRVLENVANVHKLEGDVKEVVIGAYVQSLAFSHGFSLACSILGFLVALCIREHSLK